VTAEEPRSGTVGATPTCMVRLIVSLTARTPSAENLLDALRYISTTTRLEDGCLGCSVWAGPDSTLHYVEEWDTEDTMRRRVRSDRFTSVLAVIESASEPPEVRFDFVTRTRGLDYVAEIRQNSLN
jgi:quinol monooxygenase YgiN